MQAVPVGAVGATGVIPQHEMMQVEENRIQHDAGSTDTLAAGPSSRDEGHVNVKNAEADFQVRVVPTPEQSCRARRASWSPPPADSPCAVPR